jgi:hypothetical protein
MRLAIVGIMLAGVIVGLGIVVGVRAHDGPNYCATVHPTSVLNPNGFPWHWHHATELQHLGLEGCPPVS